MSRNFLTKYAIKIIHSKMRFQVIITLNDGSKYYLEKINTTQKELNEVKKLYKIPDIKHEKALFVARLFTETELKKILNFLINNDYILKFKVQKINPFTLEDDVVSFAKLARTFTSNMTWETISFEVIDGMLIMGYGLIEENYERRKNFKNYLGTKQILNLMGKEITIKNIDKLQYYLLNIKGIEDIFEYAKNLQQQPFPKLSKTLNELEKILESSSTPPDKVIKFNKK